MTSNRPKTPRAAVTARKASARRASAHKVSGRRVTVRRATKAKAIRARAGDIIRSAKTRGKREPHYGKLHSAVSVVRIDCWHFLGAHSNSCSTTEPSRLNFPITACEKRKNTMKKSVRDLKPRKDAKGGRHHKARRLKLPDIISTPAPPAGPIPIPYPNISP
jgi:hypothetical protein